MFKEGMFFDPSHLESEKQENKKYKLFLFDVDGPIVDLTTGAVNLNVIDKIIQIQQLGHKIVFNTGRSFEYLREKLIPILEDKNFDFSNAMVIAEMGCVVANMKTSVAGEEKEKWEIEAKYLMDEEVKKSLENFVYDFFKSRFGWLIAKLEIKKSVITFSTTVVDAGREKEALDLYKSVKDELAQMVNQWLIENNLDQSYIVTANGNALDIQPKLAGKALGAREAVEKFPDLDEAFTFGDSWSDVQMKTGVEEKKISTTHYHIGDNIELSKDHLRTQNSFAEDIHLGMVANDGQQTGYFSTDKTDKMLEIIFWQLNGGKDLVPEI